MIKRVETPTPGGGKRKMKNCKQMTAVNFKKVRGLMDKLVKMVESGEYCVDMMQQNLAAIGLLKSAHQILMENHLNTCFKTAMETGSKKKKQEMTEEILKVSNLFNR